MGDWRRKEVENDKNDRVKVLLWKGGNVDRWAEIVRI